jgi:hypothetical protein
MFIFRLLYFLDTLGQSKSDLITNRRSKESKMDTPVKNDNMEIRHCHDLQEEPTDSTFDSVPFVREIFEGHYDRIDNYV